MRHLRKFNESSESNVIRRIKSNIEYIDSNIDKFIEAFSALIELNHEIYDIDLITIDKVIKSIFPSDIKYIEMANSKNINKVSGYANGELILIFLNLGFNIGYYGILYKMDLNFLLKEILKSVDFEKISNNELTYDGPEILSSSILAATPDISGHIKNMEKYIDKYYDGDKERGEFLILTNCIYLYGYGYASDIKFIKNIER